MASVLVIEKDPLVRARITRELKALGYQVGEDSTAIEPSGVPLQSEVIRAAGIVIDRRAHRVTIDHQSVTVTPREYELLLFLLENPDRVFSREQLLQYVWDQDTSIGLRTVDVHIRRLRHALEPFGYDGLLQTVRRAGYRFSVTEL